MSAPLASASTAGLPSSASSALAIGDLRSAAARDPKSAIKEVAKQFEALFMQQLMKSMREATMSSGMLDNSGTQLGTEMLDTQYATKLTGLPGGLADAIARQLERQMGAGAAGRFALAAPPIGGPAGVRAIAAAVPRIRFAARTRNRLQRRSVSGIPRPSIVAGGARIGWGGARSDATQQLAQPSDQGMRGWTGPLPRSRLPYSTARPEGDREFAPMPGTTIVSRLRPVMKKAPYAGVVAQAIAGAASAARRATSRRDCTRRYSTTRPTPTSFRASSTPPCACSAWPPEMGVSALLNIGSRAMTASYAALQVTGNNIANVNTPGYSRQKLELETSFSQQTGAGFFGKGVDVASVTRSHDAFLTREAALTASIAAADNARSTQLQYLEQVFKTGEAGIGYAAQQMFNAFVDVGNAPQDSAARQVALARVGDLAARLRNASEQVDSMQAGIAQDLRTSVASINSLSTRIADLNQRIASVQGTGHAPNELLDQRDAAIGELSGLVQVSTVAAADGTVGVFLGGSQKLVLGGNATLLSAVPDAFDPAKVQLGITEGGVTRAFPDGFVTALGRRPAARPEPRPRRCACLLGHSPRRSPAASTASSRSSSR